MSVQHLNDVKAIARTAQQLGATLPADITTALDHLDDINAGRSAAPQPGLMAKDLAQHLGDRTAMEKARKAAALELAPPTPAPRSTITCRDLRRPSARHDEVPQSGGRRRLR
jgi:hypothetical protein